MRQAARGALAQRARLRGRRQAASRPSVDQSGLTQPLSRATPSCPKAVAISRNRRLHIATLASLPAPPHSSVVPPLPRLLRGAVHTRVHAPGHRRRAAATSGGGPRRWPRCRDMPPTRRRIRMRKGCRPPVSASPSSPEQSRCRVHHALHRHIHPPYRPAPGHIHPNSPRGSVRATSVAVPPRLLLVERSKLGDDVGDGAGGAELEHHESV
eukprot:6209664-Pleurochrysis_carterae.AAC.6